MGIFEDWFIGEILSFFAGEVEGTWHDAIEMDRRRKELEDSGIDLGDEFYASLEAFEQAMYEHTKEKEHGKRCAGK